LKGQTVTLLFETPATIVRDERTQKEPTFQAIVSALLRRISSLSQFYCDTLLNLDFRGLVDRAAAVRIIKAHTQWFELERTSQKRHEKMTLRGITGEMSYAGALAEYWPFLIAGQFVHAGKQATFGFGKYSLQ
jgi:CRISPR/Cas system endoribonuclease Cas6 (RAMP superfamily)